jgi:hypothetical protein
MVRSQALESRTIGQLAKVGEVSVEAVRFYQRKGLLREPPRLGGIRRYGHEAVRRFSKSPSCWNLKPGGTASGCASCQSNVRQRSTRRSPTFPAHAMLFNA